MIWVPEVMWGLALTALRGPGCLWVGDPFVLHVNCTVPSKQVFLTAISERVPERKKPSIITSWEMSVFVLQDITVSLPLLSLSPECSIHNAVEGIFFPGWDCIYLELFRICHFSRGKSLTRGMEDINTVTGKSKFRNVLHLFDYLHQ